MRDGRSTLSKCGSQTVRTCVAATDDHYMLACRIDGALREVTFLNAIRQREVLHRLVHTREFATWNGKVTPLGGPDSNHNRVVTLAKGLSRDIDAHFHTRTELHTFGLHLFESPI